MRNPRAYVAGPITSSGILHTNLHNGIKVGEELRQIGIDPFIPHLFDFTMIVTGHPVPWEDALRMDENWITACDLLVALPGESKGKAREIAFAHARHIPVIELRRNSIFEFERVNVHEELQDFNHRWKAMNHVSGTVS